MGRKRRKNKNWPTGLYFKHGSFYFVFKGKWHNLKTSDLAQAISVASDIVAGLVLSRRPESRSPRSS